MNDDRPSFLVIGASFGQVPAIRVARELGFRTIAVDRNPSALGFEAADIGVPVDTIDIEGVLGIARAYNVRGVMTLQSDWGVPTVGAVVDALGLPGNGRAVADRCSDKGQTRTTFAEHGVPQPSFAIVQSAEQALEAASELGFPCIVKPPDGAASRGVVKVTDPLEMDAAYAVARSEARADHVLVEKYISGIELGAQAFSIGGHCELVLVHDDVLCEPPYMIPIGHSYPSSLPGDVLREVEEAVRRGVDALGIVTGPSNIDVILDENNKPYVIEIGARMGAACLPELSQYFTGIDWIKAAVQAAVGQEPDIRVTRHAPCAAYILESPDDGVFHSYHIPSAVLNHPDLLEVDVMPKPGDTVSQLRKGTDRIGKIVTRGETRSLADSLAAALRKQIEIRVLQ